MVAGRVQEVEPAVLVETRIEGQAQEAVLLLGEDLEFEGELHGAALRVVAQHLSTLLDHEDATVGRDVELHGAVEARGQYVALEARGVVGLRGRGSLERGREEREEQAAEGPHAGQPSPHYS